MLGASLPLIRPPFLKPLFLLRVFFVKMWLAYALLLFILPVAVSLNLLAAPLCVLILGIKLLLFSEEPIDCKVMVPFSYFLGDTIMIMLLPSRLGC